MSGKRRLFLNYGDRFGRLIVTQETEPFVRANGNKDRAYLCVCDCGNTKKIRLRNLTSGNTSSCGCEGVTARISANTKHGMHKTRVYHAWENMKARCTKKNNPEWKNYGERGISVCQDWINSFENFFNYIGEPPEGMSLDRINNNGNYEPGNVRWATQKEQCNNQRRSLRK
jgi:hypothetical protein